MEDKVLDHLAYGSMVGICCKVVCLWTILKKWNQKEQGGKGKRKKRRRDENKRQKGGD